MLRPWLLANGTKLSVDMDKLLRLLREDEEFRLAVMGLLGIMDIQSGIKQLVSAIARLAESQASRSMPCRE